MFFQGQNMDINRKEPDLALGRFVRNAQNNRGFTFVELLVVTVILGILALIGINGFTTFKDKARVARCSSEIRGLEKEIIAYVTEKATYPASLDDLGRGGLKDPWGNSYEYHYPPGNRHKGAYLLNTDFDLYSKGPDGIYADLISDPVSADDIIRADEGSFCDMAIRYSL
jgi:general secretion pathway protein G